MKSVIVNNFRIKKINKIEKIGRLYLFLITVNKQLDLPSPEVLLGFLLIEMKQK